MRNDDVRKTLHDINDELDGFVSLVDDFYRLLGNRNWVVSDTLNLDGTRTVVAREPIRVDSQMPQVPS